MAINKFDEYDRGGGTEYSIIADSEQELDNAINGIFSRYHPMGYGTFEKSRFRTPDGGWSSTVWRANSCD